MTYQVLARKWRPRAFSAMVGQVAVQKALRSMLQTQKLPHAFLFSGTRGVGKTTLARLFAKCMVCAQGIGDTPCGICSHCVAVDTGTHLDVIEVDAASRTKVEDTRDLMENVPYAPHSARFKIYIIDEVHMLSNHSFNALLKTLEEPPAHVKFIFATTEPEKCPVTMLSRCVHFTLKALSATELTAHLKSICESESILFEEAGLRLLAEKAKGSVRDALTLLEEARHVGEDKITESAAEAMLGLLSIETLLPLIEALIYRDAQAMLQRIAQIDAFSPDYSEVLQQLIGLWHSMTVFQLTQHYNETSGLSLATVTRYAQQFSPEAIQIFYQMCLKGQTELALAVSPKMGFEMLMLRLLAFMPASASETLNLAPPMREAAVPKVEVAQPSVIPKETFSPPPPAKETRPQPTTPSSTTPNWLDLMSTLPLAGLTKMLAAKATLLSVDSGLWTLGIGPEMLPMVNKMQTDKLSQVLSDHLHQKIIVKFEVRHDVLETPEKRQTEADAAKQDAMQTQVAEDPGLQDLINSFGATIERIGAVDS